MALIQFTRNYRDLSTDAGFQFEFYCDRCGNGYQTEFQASTLGTVTNALDAASNLFGGVLGKAANVAREVRSAGWEKAHDKAFADSGGRSQAAFPQMQTLWQMGGWRLLEHATQSLQRMRARSAGGNVIHSSAGRGQRCA